jgi:predicted esterase
MSDDKLVTEITSDEELEQAYTEVEGLLADLSLETDDDAHSTKAKELIDDIQEWVNNIHAYIYKEDE